MAKRKKKMYGSDVIASSVGMTVGAGVVGSVAASMPAGSIPPAVATNVGSAMTIASIGVPLQASQGVLKQLKRLK